MCGRFNQSHIQKKIDKEARTDFEIDDDGNFVYYNISPAMRAVIQTPEGLVKGRFGISPAWKPTQLFLNARSDGDNNPEDKATGWEVGIHKKPAFRSAFKSRRCVIPVTGFIEGPKIEKLKKPYLFSKPDSSIFYLAGLYEPFTDQKTGEQLPSFAILTTPSNVLTNHILHHRAPLMLQSDSVSTWLNMGADSRELFMLMQAGYVEPGLQITPLRPELVTSGKIHTQETMEPSGEIITLAY
jgi:putative SOS response-associated peptidase YedK